MEIDASLLNELKRGSRGDHLRDRCQTKHRAIGIYRMSRLQLSHAEPTRDRDFAGGNKHEYRAWNLPTRHFVRKKLVGESSDSKGIERSRAGCLLSRKRSRPGQNGGQEDQCSHSNMDENARMFVQVNRWSVPAHARRRRRRSR